MKPYHFAKSWIKFGRWRIRRLKAALVWGFTPLRNAPSVFGNSMPKSGSHLLAQILKGLTGLGPFINPGLPPVNRSEGNQPLPEGAVLTNIHRMQPGDIRYGYIHAKEPFLSLLTEPGRATFFLYRDPRDMLVSHVFYATDMNPSHGMHQYYTQRLHSMEERLNAAIEGVDEPGYELSSVCGRYDAYLGWLEQPEVLCLRFEDLTLEQEAALGRVMDFLERRGFTPCVSRSQAVATLQGAIKPRKSGTFRKGQPGDWREHFTQKNKARFKAVAGDLLIRLGYEPDNDW
ncbi:MAG: sulfotransferase domain-containing protein [Chloroflexota bacterium]